MEPRLPLGARAFPSLFPSSPRPLISNNPRPHPIRNQIRAMTSQRVLRRGRRKQRARQRLRGLDTRLLLHFRRGIDVVLLWARTSADRRGQDLLESLGGGYFLDGFEILW